MMSSTKDSEKRDLTLKVEKRPRGEIKESSYNILPPCIYRTPFPELEFQKPELISIGPYHKDVDHPFDKYKHAFLEKLLSRTSNYPERDLSFYVAEIMALENQARACYSDDLGMSSRDFVKMMLLDGCFIVELLRQCGGSREDDLLLEDTFNMVMPWQIPILVQDLLLLENQIPFFLLLKLFALSTNIDGKPEVSVTTMALKFFDLAFPLSTDFISENRLLKPNHLLDLFVMTFLPSNLRTISDLDHPLNRGSKRAEDGKEYQSPVPLLKGAAELQLAGIKFMPSRARSFLDFDFKGGVLELPLVTINNLFSTILVNSMALETCSPYYNNKPKPFTRYIYFMSSLIKEASDVKFLCLKGIISRFSSNDKRVMDFFTLLGRYAVPAASDYDLWDTIREMRCYNRKTKTSKRQFLMGFFHLFVVVVVSSLLCLRLLENLGTRYTAIVFFFHLSFLFFSFFLEPRYLNRYDIRDSELTNIGRNSDTESDSVAIFDYEPSSGQGQQKEERAVALQPRISESAFDPEMVVHDFEPQLRPKSSPSSYYVGDFGPSKLRPNPSPSISTKGPSPSKLVLMLKEQIMKLDELKEQDRLKKPDLLEVRDRLEMLEQQMMRKWKRELELLEQKMIREWEQELEMMRDQLKKEKLERERERELRVQKMISEWDQEQEMMRDQ